MTVPVISSRSPGGARCPVCGAAICVEPTEPPGDASCPNCGALLWFSRTPDGLLFYDDESVEPIRARILNLICKNFGVHKNEIANVDTVLRDLGGDSLEDVEFIMELEELFEITIPDHDAERIKTIRDVVDCILQRGL